MESTDSLATSESQDPILCDYQCELKRIDDFAVVFLMATNGDIDAAEKVLDNFVDLIVEAGVLSTWRYRLLLDQIREGL